MMNLYEAIGCRHSVRKYTDREVTEKLRGQILSYFDKTSRLNDRIRVEAVIFDNTKKKARCPRTLEGGCSLLSGDLFGPGGRLRAQCRLSDGADGALYDGKRVETCYLGSVQPAQKVRGGKRCLMMVARLPEGKLYRESPLAKRLRSMNSVFSRKKPESR